MDRFEIDTGIGKQPKKDNRIGAIIFAGVISGVVFGGTGIVIGKLISDPKGDEQKIIDQYRILKNDWLYADEIDNLDEVVASSVVSAASEKIDDPYTFYTQSMKEQNLSTENENFGFDYKFYDGGIIITSVYDDKDLRNKIHVNDVFYSLKDESGKKYIFKNHQYNDVTNYLNSDSLNNQEIRFYKDDGEEVVLEKQIYTKKLAEIVNTPTSENNYNLQVRVNTFLGESYDKIKYEISKYKDDTKTLTLDLRRNGGGYISQARRLLSMFLSKNTVGYKLINKDGKINDKFDQKVDPTFKFDNYKVIIDSNSASATETVALALRSMPNVKLYGFTSYGKGIAQSFKQFEDGSVLRYTSAYVYGPERDKEDENTYPKHIDNCICVHKIGIQPDYLYSDDYQFLYTSIDYSKSIAVSEASQNRFLKCVSTLHPEYTFPKSYNENYHFTDCVNQYATILKDIGEIGQNEKAFTSDGKVSKIISDKLMKENYKMYLKKDNDLTKYVLESNI